MGFPEMPIYQILRVLFHTGISFCVDNLISNNIRRQEEHKRNPIYRFHLNDIKAILIDQPQAMAYTAYQIINSILYPFSSLLHSLGHPHFCPLEDALFLKLLFMVIVFYIIIHKAQLLAIANNGRSHNETSIS